MTGGVYHQLSRPRALLQYLLVGGKWGSAVAKQLGRAAPMWEEPCSTWVSVSAACSPAGGGRLLERGQKRLISAPADQAPPVLLPEHASANGPAPQEAYAADPYSRQLLRLPRPSAVDFRASCFCHKRPIDIGFVCSVCLSIFCEKLPACITCGADFSGGAELKALKG